MANRKTFSCAGEEPRVAVNAGKVVGQRQPFNSLIKTVLHRLTTRTSDEHANGGNSTADPIGTKGMGQPLPGQRHGLAPRSGNRAHPYWRAARHKRPTAEGAWATVKIREPRGRNTGPMTDARATRHSGGPVRPGLLCTRAEVSSNSANLLVSVMPRADFRSGKQANRHKVAYRTGMFIFQSSTPSPNRIDTPGSHPGPRAVHTTQSFDPGGIRAKWQSIHADTRRLPSTVMDG